MPCLHTRRAATSRGYFVRTTLCPADMPVSSLSAYRSPFFFFNMTCLICLCPKDIARPCRKCDRQRTKLNMIQFQEQTATESDKQKPTWSNWIKKWFTSFLRLRCLPVLLNWNICSSDLYILTDMTISNLFANMSRKICNTNFRHKATSSDYFLRTSEF